MFKKPEYLIVIISFLITSLISFVIGLAGLMITGKFWGFFILAFAMQIIIFAIINTFLIRKDVIEGTKLFNEQLEATSKHTVRLTCAYCQVSNVVPVVLNRENRYKCVSCNQVNGIKMQFFSTQITTPLEKIVIPIEDNDLTNG